MSNIIKKYGMAMVAILMIVGFSAFKVVEKKTTNTVTKTWYFTGDNISQVTLPEHYTDEEIDAPDCDDVKEIVCTIIAPDGSPGEPDLSPAMQSLINQAMSNKQPNSVVQSFRTL